MRTRWIVLTGISVWAAAVAAAPGHGQNLIGAAIFGVAALAFFGAGIWEKDRE
jgi:hypothetical protein